HHADGHRKQPQLIRPSSSVISSEDICQVPDVREEVTGSIYQEWTEELLGPGVVYDPRSQRELAANIFAAELLMPLERVRMLYLSSHISPNQLTTLFDVSQAAMLNRLAGWLREPSDPTGGPRGNDPGISTRPNASK